MGGESVGPYVLGKTIARGASGKVKSATHRETGLKVAVKIISRGRVPGHKNTIAREIAIMRLLDHPNVLNLFDVYETRRHYFLVMELVNGGELFDYILQRKRLPRQEALRIFSQIVQGIEFCHMHSICHRDLKPENLLLDHNCNIKIADFGMAQVIQKDTSLNTFCGSPHYGAPEIVSGLRYDGRKSDVWSLGVVLYALVTGMLPFDHKEITKLLAMVKRAKYVIPDTVDRDVADLLRQMLEPDVNKRICTEDIKEHDCFKSPDQNNPINMYFPLHPVVSPALEQLAKTPIQGPDDVDLAIVHDLVGLNWGTVEDITRRLLAPYGPEDEAPLELILYMMLLSRHAAKRDLDEQEEAARKAKEEAARQKTEAAQLSLPVVSMEQPPSPMTPMRARQSHEAESTRSRGAGAFFPDRVPNERVTRRVVTLSSLSTSPTQGADQYVVAGMSDIPEEKKSPDSGGDTSGSATQGLPPRTPMKGKKRPGSITTNRAQGDIDTAHAGPETPVNSATTPHFHRPAGRRFSLGSEEPDSARDPVTPSPKVSWFANQRQPSITINAPSPMPAPSGVFSTQKPEKLSHQIQQVLESMSIPTQKTKDSLMLKCTCTAMVLRDTWQIVVLDDQMNPKYEQKSEPDSAALQAAAAAAGDSGDYDEDVPSSELAAMSLGTAASAPAVAPAPVAAIAAASPGTPPNLPRASRASSLGLGGTPGKPPKSPSPSPFRGGAASGRPPMSPGRPPLSPSTGAFQSPHKAQRVRFCVTITHNPSDNICSVSLTHTSGHNVIYRAIHSEIVRQLEL